MSDQTKPDWSRPSTTVLLGDATTQTASRANGFAARLRETLAAVYPGVEHQLIVAGRAGDRIGDLLERLDRDALAHRPDRVIVLPGVTDVWYAARGLETPPDEYRRAVEAIVKRCRESEAAIWLGTPMLIGERVRAVNSFDDALELRAEIVRRVARELNVLLVDGRARFREALLSSNPGDVGHGIFTVDGIHLNDAGSRAFANWLAESLGVDLTRSGARVVRHMVFFRYRPSCDAATISMVESRFRAMAKSIDGIVDFECGTNCSPEGLSRGFTHAYLVTFRDESARDAYLVHPMHEGFVTDVKPQLDDVLVVDYWCELRERGDRS